MPSIDGACCRSALNGLWVGFQVRWACPQSRRQSVICGRDAGKCCLALAVVRDGGVSKVGIFLNLSGGGGPDGLAVDCEGGLVVAQPGLGVLRFDAAGCLTHFIEVPKNASTSNIVFGGPGNRDLFIVDSGCSRILTVEMPFAGYQKA